MDTSTESATVFSFMQSNPIEVCADMGGTLWDSWGSWLLENPWFIQSLHEKLEQEGFPPDQCAAAITQWLSASLVGLANVSLAHVESKDRVTWWDVENLDGGGEPSVGQVEVSHGAGIELVAHEDGQCVRALHRWEKELIVCHPNSPVVVATHTPQWDGEGVEPNDMGESTHLGVGTLCSTPPADRAELFEKDTEGSDMFRDDEMASENAKNHEGMFFYTARLYPPAAPLRSFRSSLEMERSTRASAKQGAPRVRF